MCDRPGSVRGRASLDVFSVRELIHYRKGLAAWAQIGRDWLARQPQAPPRHRLHVDFVDDETEQLLASLFDIDNHLRQMGHPAAREH